MRFFLPTSLIIVLRPLLLMPLLVALLVHVQSVPDHSEDIEAPGLVHPVNILILSISVAVLVVMLVLVTVVSRLGLQFVECRYWIMASRIKLFTIDSG